MGTERPEGLVSGEAVSVAPCVLLVDDEATMRVALRRYFQRLGWTVREADCGECAERLLEEAGSERVDLVICDLRMPRGSGQAFYTWMCRARPCLVSRLVFTTGDVLSADAEGFLRAAGRPVLAKPFELVDLGRLVAEVASAAHAA